MPGLEQTPERKTQFRLFEEISTVGEFKNETIIKRYEEKITEVATLYEALENSMRQRQASATISHPNISREEAI